MYQADAGSAANTPPARHRARRSPHRSPLQHRPAASNAGQDRQAPSRAPPPPHPSPLRPAVARQPRTTARHARPHRSHGPRHHPIRRAIAPPIQPSSRPVRIQKHPGPKHAPRYPEESVRQEQVRYKARSAPPATRPTASARPSSHEWTPPFVRGGHRAPTAPRIQRAARQARGRPRAKQRPSLSFHPVHHSSAIPR